MPEGHHGQDCKAIASVPIIIATKAMSLNPAYDRCNAMW